MPPNKGEQPRRGKGPRRTAEPKTNNTQGNGNAVSQPPIPQPAQAQSSTRQSPNMANQNNAQRPSQQPVPMIAPLSYSDILQNNQNQIQRSGQAPPTPAQSSARQSSSIANQNTAQRHSQQPVPMIASLSYSDVLQNNLNQTQRSSQAPPTPAQSSARQSFNVVDRNKAQRSSQQSVPMIDSGSPRDTLQTNQNSPQRSGGTPRARPTVMTGDLSRPPRSSSPGGNQAKPETGSSLKHVGHHRGSTSTDAEISNVANSSNDANTREDPGASKIYGGQNRAFPEPNEAVTKVEDEFIESNATPIHQDIEFCVRPGYGSAGKHTLLWTNYLELKTPPEGLQLFSYSITVDPDANNKVPKGERKTQLIRLLLENDRFQALMPDLFATDFNATIITKEPVEIEPDASGENIARFPIEFRSEGMKNTPVVPILYTVCIKQTSDLDYSDLVDYLNPSHVISSYNKSPILQAFNVILGHHNKEANRLARVGNNRMFSHDRHPEISHFSDLGGGLIALRGYYTNAIGATSRTLLNVNISHGAFYKSSYNTRGSSLVSLMWARFPDNIDYGELHQFLRGLRVSTTHLSQEHMAFGKIRTICGLAMEGDGAKLDHPPQFTEVSFGGNPWQVRFYEDFATHSSSSKGSSNNPSETASGREIKPLPSRATGGSYTTVKGFFDRTYPVASGTLKKQNPVVNVGTRAKPIYLPAEVCKVLPGQVSRAKLDGSQTSRMINFAKLNPDECAKCIVEQGRKALGYDFPPNPMSEFGVTVGNQLITVPGRVLSIPSIEYKNKSKAPSQGSWNFSEVGLYQPVKVGEWYCLRLGIGDLKDIFPSARDLKDHLGSFVKMMGGCGIGCKAPTIRDETVPNSAGLITRLEDCLREFHAKSDTSTTKKAPGPLLLLIILPDSDPEPYRTIKKLADTELGIHTVCVIGQKRKFYHANPQQYFANVVLKINLKLGGMNHKLAESSQALGLIGNRTTMVVGIDVTHPSHGSKEGAPSIFAVVSSKDQHLSQWPVRLGVQRKSREEVISNGQRLTEIFKDLLKLWRAENKKYPQNIVVYRDGVSEGQYSAVIEQELAALRKACNSLYTEKPRMTLIVVAKRHHTRFYPTDSKQADSTTNAKCGTVVDQGITHARTWDFFLQSHSVIKGGMETVLQKNNKGGIDKVKKEKPSGTARPAHYVVLHDEVFADIEKRHRADTLQQITHNMCYLYGPATKAISICPPVYLADKACTRARLYLSDAFRPPTQDEIDKRKDTKDEKDEEPGEKKQREEEEERELQSYQDRIKVHENLKDTMFYI